MSQYKIKIPEVDSVQITLVVDNCINIGLPSSEVIERFPLAPNAFEHPIPFAEHGFSALIRVQRDDYYSTVLFDTGVSRKGFLYNLDALEVNAKDIQAIVLSHGHPDHAMGLPGLVDRLGIRSLPLVLHPDAYLERKLVLPNGAEIGLPAPKRNDFRREYIEVVEEVGPSMLVNDMVLVSGEVTRTMPFEQGFAIHYAKRHDHWEPDPFIMDDQCVIINVREKGLVIVTGCGHAGIINTVLHAQAITGIQTVYAVIGGFHLSGKLFEPIIPAVIEALNKIKPRYLMPGHCTGWNATHQIARAMPEAFIANSVGTTLMLD